MLTTIYDLSGVTVWEFQREPVECYFGVSDTHYQHYKITFRSDDAGAVSLSVSAEWSDDRPGQLAGFTHDVCPGCFPTDTLSISDGGLLSALARVEGAKTVDFRHGMLLQLPLEYVQPVRLAIAKAREIAARTTAAIAGGRLATIPTALTADERTAAAWWQSIFDERERDSWMRRAGNTGLVVDAYLAFQATTAGLAPAGWERVQA